MSRSLKHEEILLHAVRKFFESCVLDGLSSSLASLSAVTSTLPLSNLDLWESLLRSELWSDTRSAQTRKWRFLRTAQRQISWLDLCSADGFIRERAMLSIQGGAPDGFLFSLALRRLNDWVPQVREAARSQIPKIVANSEPKVIVDALWGVLPHFASWGRMTIEEQDVLSSLLANDKLVLTLKSRITNAVSGPSTRVLVQASRTPALDPWLNEIAAKAIQPSTRAKAYRALLEHRVAWTIGRKWVWTDLKWCKGKLEPVLQERRITVHAPMLQTLRATIADKSPAVRRVGAELLIKHLNDIGAESHILAEKLANDSSAYVSERGRYGLSKLSGASTQVDTDAT